MKKIISTEVTESNVKQVLGLLSDAPEKIKSARSRLTDDLLVKPLGKGERSLIENLAHLLYCERLSSDFIYLALLRTDAVFPDIHPEREYGKLLRYDLFPFETLFENFVFRRTALLRTLSSLKMEQWSRAILEKGKKRKESVYWRARSMALHEFEHIAEIENKLAQPWVKQEFYFG